MESILLIKALICNLFKCNNATEIVALSGIIMSFISVILACFGIRQTVLARKDIALNHVKIKQVEVMGNLLRHLNSNIIRINVLVIGQDAQDNKTKEFSGNIFEFGAILNKLKSYGEDYTPNSPIFLSNESNSILNVDDFEFDGFVDADVTNALCEFNGIMEHTKIDLNEYQGETIFLLQTRKNNIIFSTSQDFSNAKELKNSHLNTIEGMSQLISNLKTSIENWYKKNNIGDCNILIRTDNLNARFEKDWKS